MEEQTARQAVNRACAGMLALVVHLLKPRTLLRRGGADGMCKAFFMVTRFLILLLLSFAAGCGSKNEYNYQQYGFDQQVISKLPLYDSIGQVLLQNFAALQEEMKEHSSFDYGRSKTARLVNPALPAAAAEKIHTYMEALGDDFLTEFSVYKDSSIKFSVRDKALEGHDLVARERLSYLPNGGRMQRREPPDKDTILHGNWQYWIQFDEKPVF